MSTIRARQDTWSRVTAGVRKKVLRNGSQGASVLLELQPGVSLPVHRHAWLEEAICLAGACGPAIWIWDRGLSGFATGSRHGQITSCPRRCTPALFARHFARQSRPANCRIAGDGSSAGAHSTRCCCATVAGSRSARASRCCLSGKGDGLASRYVRLSPGATLPAHDHGMDEECMMIEGDAFWRPLDPGGDFIWRRREPAMAKSARTVGRCSFCAALRRPRESRFVLVSRWALAASREAGVGVADSTRTVVPLVAPPRKRPPDRCRCSPMGRGRSPNSAGTAVSAIASSSKWRLFASCPLAKSRGARSAGASGSGLWLVEPEGPGVRLTHRWDVELQRPWMRFCAVALAGFRQPTLSVMRDGARAMAGQPRLPVRSRRGVVQPDLATEPTDSLGQAYARLWNFQAPHGALLIRSLISGKTMAALRLLLAIVLLGLAGPVFAVCPPGPGTPAPVSRSPTLPENSIGWPLARPMVGAVFLPRDDTPGHSRKRATFAIAKIALPP